MNRDRIVEHLRDTMERQLPRSVPRELRYHVPKKGRAVTIIGPRRSGKTYFLYQQMKRLEQSEKAEEILYINLEDDRLIGLRLGDMDLFLRTYHEIAPDTVGARTHMFLDEVQMVDGWERYVRRILDTEDVRMWLTGSSSRLLAKEIATSMRGRTTTYTILPFSFREYLRAKGHEVRSHVSSKERSLLLFSLRDYMRFGGFPEVVLEEEEDVKLRILKEYVDVMLMRDIVERHGIRNVRVMRLLFGRLLASLSSEFSVHKYHRQLKAQDVSVSKNTLYEYMGYLEDAFALFSLRRFSYKLKEVDQSLPKVYPIDTGLVTQAGGRFTEDHGPYMEATVALELLRRRGDDPSMEIYHWRDASGKEVDFVVKIGKRVTSLIQCCYILEDIHTRSREIGPLLKASGALKCDDLVILTWDQEGEENVGGKRIKLRALWRWLLGQSQG
jgi:predicted AAA+ superfamily ATPase